MSELIYYACAFAVGLAGLIWSADRFVEGSVGLASGLGFSKLIIGVTIVSLGTSAPEIMISLHAAFSGAGDLAVGNAIGSNIANIGLVLGVTTLLTRVPFSKTTPRQELALLLVATAITGVFLMDSTLSAAESIILLLLLPASLTYLLIVKQRTVAHPPANEVRDTTLTRSFSQFVLGLALLIATSRVLVWSATQTADYFGISPLLIGLTVVAVGTSLPELAASVTSALRGHHDIALGNVVGSNLFNLLAVLSVPGMMSDLHLDKSVFSRDFATMAGLTGLLVIAMAFGLKRAHGTKQANIGPVTGLLFILVYTGYYYSLFKMEMP